MRDELGPLEQLIVVLVSLAFILFLVAGGMQSYKNGVRHRIEAEIVKDLRAGKTVDELDRCLKLVEGE